MFEPILKWQVVAQRVPWGVIILLGGGFALASGAKVCSQLKHRYIQSHSRYHYQSH